MTMQIRPDHIRRKDPFDPTHRQGMKIFDGMNGAHLPPNHV